MPPSGRAIFEHVRVSSL